MTVKTQEREYLHSLVERIPLHLLTTATGVLEAFARGEPDPLPQALAEAPEDDEPVTAEEERAVQEAWEAVRRGDILADEELDKELAR